MSIVKPDLKAPPMALPPAGAPGEATAQAVVPAKPAARAALKFLSPGNMSATHTLAHPFELDGANIAVVTIRRLTLGEVGEIISQGSIELYDFYAAMTGLPVAVLRGLEGDDGQELLEACDPFLPRLALELFAAPTPPAGGASPSSPAAP